MYVVCTVGYLVLLIDMFEFPLIKDNVLFIRTQKKSATALSTSVQVVTDHVHTERRVIMAVFAFFCLHCSCGYQCKINACMSVLLEKR